MTEPRVSLFIDYQNVHLVAHGLFRGSEPTTPSYHSLIHPGRLADAIDRAREASDRPGRICAVHVFRGLPGAAKEPSQYRRNQRQAAEWTRDRRVSVTHRPLRYPRGWPNEKAREKGVDVLVAVTLVRQALLRLSDILILASADTDLEPALELVLNMPDAPIVEVFRWDGGGQLRPSMPAGGPKSVWCNRLGYNDFLASIDPKAY